MNDTITNVKTQLDTGLVHVYTGNGKGKTTAALGLGLRAVGRGLRVIFFQFMKGQPYGELETVKRLSPDFSIVQLGRDGFVDRAAPEPRDYDLAKAGLQQAKLAIASGEYDLVILDEANCAVDFGLLSVDDLVATIEGKPERLELVITGRSAKPEILAKADLITEMKEVRHYFTQGQDARMGIEY